MLERFEQNADNISSPDSLPEEISEVIELLKQTSFYAPVLTDTFIAEADKKTLLSASESDSLSSKLFLGARMARHPDGYMRLIYNDNNVKYLRLVISEGVTQRYKDPTQTLLDDDPIDSFERLIITTNGERRTGPSRYIRSQQTGQSEYQQQVLSDINMKFANEPFRLAPADSSSNFELWLLSEFVPEFLSKRVAPVANISSQYLEDWI